MQSSRKTLPKPKTGVFGSILHRCVTPCAACWPSDRRRFSARRLGRGQVGGVGLVALHAQVQRRTRLRLRVAGQPRGGDEVRRLRQRAAAEVLVAGRVGGGEAAARVVGEEAVEERQRVLGRAQPGEALRQLVVPATTCRAAAGGASPTRRSNAT
jgi:hypothetical protein